MPKVLSPNFSKLDVKTRNLIQRMNRFDLSDRLELIEGAFSKVAFRTSFTLADQVLLHALISNQANVAVALDGDLNTSNVNLLSLKAITGDLYGVVFDTETPENLDLVIATNNSKNFNGQFLSRDSKGKTLLINPLADWNETQLVEYILAHEVPVNPEDMPGFSARAA